MEIDPKKRRLQRTSRPKAIVSSGYMPKLPDDVLLHIFKNLGFQDLIAVKRVCRRFRSLASDRSLWINVEISPCIVSVKALYKLLRNHFPEDMRSLKLRGYLNYYRGKPGHLRCVLTNTFLKLLNKQCPKLETFNLRESHIPESLNFSDFPKNLTTLQLWNCHFASNRVFFSDVPKAKLAASLRKLDLSLSKGLSVSAFEQIAKLRNLEVLRLCGSEAVNHKGIQLLAGCLPKLETLDLGQLTNITDSTLELITSHFKNLQNLNISKCTVTFEGIEKMAENGQRLRKLIINQTIVEQQMKSLISKFPEIKFISNTIN